MKYLRVKWAIASLVMPIVVLVFQPVSSFEYLALTFWPGALILLSLGGPEARPLVDVIYVWSVAVGSNVILYLGLGAASYYVRQRVSK